MNGRAWCQLFRQSDEFFQVEQRGLVPAFRAWGSGLTRTPQLPFNRAAKVLNSVSLGCDRGYGGGGCW